LNESSSSPREVDAAEVWTDRQGGSITLEIGETEAV